MRDVINIKLFCSDCGQKLNVRKSENTECTSSAYEVGLAVIVEPCFCTMNHKRDLDELRRIIDGGSKKLKESIKQ